MSTKRSLALLGATSLLLSILPAAAFAQDASAAPTAAPSETAKAVTVAKLAETKSPQEISALWAKASGQKADTVLIATAAKFPDSLASGTLQGKLGAPLLFVGDKVDDVTKAAIKNLGATKAVILGDEKAVSKSVEAELKELGITAPERLGGLARVETSIKIAERTGAKDDTIIIARQNDYADAIAAGALGAKTGYPVIVVPGETYKDSNDADVNLHPAVAKYLSDNNIKKVIVAGGEKAISKPVFDAIKAVVPSTERVKGDTRTGTALALADLWTDTKNITVVDGYETDNIGFYNGFAAALTAARNNAPILLSQNAVFTANALNKATATSGTGAYCGTLVDATVCEQVTKKLEAAQQTIKLDVKAPEEDKPSDKPTDKPVTGDLAIAPTDQAVVVATRLPGDQDDQRIYEVTGLDDDTTYNIAVFNANRVRQADGKVTFLNNDDGDGKPITNGRAVFGNVQSEVRLVNGKTIAEGQGQLVAAKPANGKIQFTVQGNGYEVVTPVLFKDDNGDSLITLNESGNPTESLAIGGNLKVLPYYARGRQDLGMRAEGDTENYWDYKSTVDAAAIVTEVDNANNLIVAKKGGNFYSVKYDSNDSLHIYYSGKKLQVDMENENAFWSSLDAARTAHTAAAPDIEASDSTANFLYTGKSNLTDSGNHFPGTAGKLSLDDFKAKIKSLSDWKNLSSTEQRKFVAEAMKDASTGVKTSITQGSSVETGSGPKFPEEKIVVADDADVGGDGFIRKGDTIAYRYPKAYKDALVKGTPRDYALATEAEFKSVLSPGDKIIITNGGAFQPDTQFQSDLTLINDDPGLPIMNSDSVTVDGTSLKFDLQFSDAKLNKNPAGYSVELKRTDPKAKTEHTSNPYANATYSTVDNDFSNADSKAIPAGTYSDEDPETPGLQFTVSGFTAENYYAVAARFIKNGERGPWTELKDQVFPFASTVDRSDVKATKVVKTKTGNQDQTYLVLEFDRPVLPTDKLAANSGTATNGFYTVNSGDAESMITVAPADVAGNQKKLDPSANSLVLLKDLASIDATDIADSVAPGEPTKGSKFVAIKIAGDIPGTATGEVLTNYNVTIAPGSFQVPSERVSGIDPTNRKQVIQNAFKNR